MSDIPVSYSDVAGSISTLSRELARAAHDLRIMHEKAAKASVAFTIAHAKAYLATEGIGANGKPLPIPTREAKANLETEEQLREKEIAKATLDAQITYIYSLRTRIDAARSGGSLLRAEIELDKIK